MANGEGNGWSTVKVFTVILAINAVLLPLAVSIVSGITSGYGKKFEATASILGDHEKRIAVVEDRLLTKQEKRELLELIAKDHLRGDK